MFLFRVSRHLYMFTHLAWCWWAADPVRLMLDPRAEMESLRRWRLPQHVWDIVEPRVYDWVNAQIIAHHPGEIATPQMIRHGRSHELHDIADKLGKGIHTHILYEILLPVIQPVHVYKPHICFKETLRSL